MDAIRGTLRHLSLHTQQISASAKRSNKQMRTSVVLSIAAALTAVAVASSGDASARSQGGGRDQRQSVNVRDHRAPKEVKVRDHRAPKEVSVRPQGKFNWVEKKGQPGHWERARAEVKSGPTVRDHRAPRKVPEIRPFYKKAKSPPMPKVNDHRAPREASGRPEIRPFYKARKAQTSYQGGVKVTDSPQKRKVATPPPSQTINHTPGYGGR
jgi:hypothetical protein